MVKVLVSLDDHLLRQIDRQAKRRGLSRSAYLAALAARDAALAAGPGATEGARAALAALDSLFSGRSAPEATAMIRAERDGR